MDSVGDLAARDTIGGDINMKGVSTEGEGSTMGCLGSTIEGDSTMGGRGYPGGRLARALVCSVLGAEEEEEDTLRTPPTELKQQHTVRGYLRSAGYFIKFHLEYVMGHN